MFGVERVVTVSEVLDGHVSLDLDCLEPLYLHGYLGQLQVGGQVVQFLIHRGFKVVSPACLRQIGGAFRRQVASFAKANHIPVVDLKAADRNIEVMRPYLERAAASRPCDAAFALPGSSATRWGLRTPGGREDR